MIVITWDKDRKLDWKAGIDLIKILDKDILYANCVSQETLIEDLDYLKTVIEKGSEDASIYLLSHLLCLLTEDGSETCDRICALNSSEDLGILTEIGFGLDNINYKEVLFKILKNKALQPLLLNIDPVLDDLLEKSLKGKKT